MANPIIKCSGTYAAYEITMPDGSKFLVSYAAFVDMLQHSVQTADPK